jgi:hypothetical protein
MCRCVEKLVRWLHRRNGHQPYVFLNSVGLHWTDAFVQRMDSLRHRAQFQSSARSPLSNIRIIRCFCSPARAKGMYRRIKWDIPIQFMEE